MSFYATVAIGVCIACSFETVRQISQVFKLIEHLDDFIEKSERKKQRKSTGNRFFQPFLQF